MLKFILLVCLYLISLPLQAQICHFIVICNPKGAKFQNTAKQSYDFFTEELPAQIKKHIGMEVQVHSYYAKASSLYSLDTTIASLSLTDKDLLLFWYDGHGYNENEKQRTSLLFGTKQRQNNKEVIYPDLQGREKKWPTLLFADRQSRNLEQIYADLKSKNAGLTLVFANANNQKKPFNRSKIIASNSKERENKTIKISRERLEDLFLHSRGSVIACSSRHGEMTLYDEKEGAIFYLAFKNELNKLLDENKNGSASWLDLIRNTAKSTQDIAAKSECSQIPKTYIAIKGDKNADTIAADGSLNIEMVFVEGDSFLMGCNSPDETYACEDDEKPAHTVIVHSFYMGKYEITQAQWRSVMGFNPSVFSNCDNCPVENISWDDAKLFIQRLNNKTQKKYRLPTEAEWEYAARGGKQTRNYLFAGSNNPKEVAQYYSNNNKKPRHIGSKKPNELGIYDMSGNVHEWCEDWYDEGYYAISPKSNPSGISNKKGSLRVGEGYPRVMRGGSWCANAEDCRVSFRFSRKPKKRSSAFGLRLVLEP